MLKNEEDAIECLEYKFRTMGDCPVVYDVEECKEFLDLLEYVDQPINGTLSSLLQIVCQYAHSDIILKFLLEQGANPNYLDIDGHDAFYYANDNKDQLAGLLFIGILSQYSENFPKSDPTERRALKFRLIKDEIMKHRKEILIQEIKSSIWNKK